MSLKAYGGSGGTAVLILNLDITQQSIINRTLQQFYLWGECHQCLPRNSSGGPQWRSVLFGEHKNLLPLPGIEPRFLGRPTCSIVNILNNERTHYAIPASVYILINNKQSLYVGPRAQWRFSTVSQDICVRISCSPLKPFCSSLTHHLPILQPIRILNRAVCVCVSGRRSECRRERTEGREITGRENEEVGGINGVLRRVRREMVGE